MRKLEDLSNWKLRDLNNEHGTLHEKGVYTNEAGREVQFEARVQAHSACKDGKCEAPDPTKRAELLARAMNTECPSCAKLIGDHTLEEIRACWRRER